MKPPPSYTYTDPGVYNYTCIDGCIAIGLVVLQKNKPIVVQNYMSMELITQTIPAQQPSDYQPIIYKLLLHPVYVIKNKLPSIKKHKKQTPRV